MTAAARIPTRAEAVATCWEAGDLSYKLYAHQELMRDAFYAYEGRVFPLLASRRVGKSRTGSGVIATEACIKKPGAIVRIGAATQKMVKQIVEPHLVAVHEDAPAQYKPKHYRQDGVWEFPNGSIIQASGCENGGADRLRGTEMDLGVIEEAGFIKDLRYLVQDVLLPQTITTDGKIIMPTSPPKSPAHELVGYITQAEAGGYLFTQNIYDAGHITPAQIEEYMRECGGEKSSTWQREYLCKIVVDETRAVMPEFTEHEEAIVREQERPEYCDRYVVGDFGFHDLTVILFAYYDFRQAKLVVEDELVFQHTTSGEIIPAIKAKERELWGVEKVYRRACDADTYARADMVKSHDYPWAEVKKDNKEAAINRARLIISDENVVIHPRCHTLRSHLRHAIWNKSRSTFERSGEFGHFDGVDAFIYLVRAINKARNPFPQIAKGVSEDTHHIREHAIKPSPGIELAKQILRGPKRRR